MTQRDTVSTENGHSAVSGDAAPPAEEDGPFDEDSARMVCGHEGRLWSSDWRRCFACSTSSIAPNPAAIHPSPD